MSPQEIIDTITTYSTHAPTEAVINIIQSAVTGPYVDPTYMAILKHRESQTNNQEFQKIVFLFLNSMKSLLKHRESALSFVLNTLLQAKYNLLNDLPTLATLSPSRLARETGESPEYSVVSAMLAAGHASLSSFQDQVEVTLQDLREEMTRINPISGPFTPSVCEQLFNNTPAQVKPIPTNKGPFFNTFTQESFIITLCT
jgi:hypothetical protein